MNYRSIADLSRTIRGNLHKLPRDIDLIVGVPRSGMLAANMIALLLNLKSTDIPGYLANLPVKHGNTRKSNFFGLLKPSDANHVLVVDDSICSGGSLDATKALVSGFFKEQKITYCAVYSTSNCSQKVDIFLEVVEQPRLFEWNVMHRPFLVQCCLDIDGVLCLDPTNVENDDGTAYTNFLINVPPLVVPSYPVGHLVTSRLEKYRVETEQWLTSHGVIYEQLHMLDLPDAVTRRRLNCHASFKAEIFRSLKNMELFIESDPAQSADIANLAGKPVLCFGSQKMYYPGISYAFVEKQAYSFARRIRNLIIRRVT